MEYKINDKLTIELKEYKTYAVSKAVKIALLDWVIVSDWVTPSVPATNAIKSEETLILWMTNLTTKQLEVLREEEVEKLLAKINSGVTVPTKAPLDK